MGINCGRGGVCVGVEDEKEGEWVAPPMAWIEAPCARAGDGRGTNIMGAVWPSRTGPCLGGREGVGTSGTISGIITVPRGMFACPAPMGTMP